VLGGGGGPPGGRRPGRGGEPPPGRLPRERPGDAVSTGTIRAGDNTVTVADPGHWDEEHGIRVPRAGPTRLLNHADGGWQPEAAVRFETLAGDAAPRVRDGSTTAVVCSASGSAGPQDLCWVEPPGLPFTYDEIRMWVQTSSPATAGQLALQASGPGFPPEPQNQGLSRMEIPATSPAWEEEYVPIEGRGRFGG
jgi:hypothetical protein